MTRFSILALLVGVIGVAVNGINVDPAMECSFCHVSLGMVIETEVQIKYIGNMKKDKCGSMGNLEKKACEWGIDEASFALLKKAKPEEVCAKVGMCKAPFDSCSLYTAWPVKDLPPQPTAWPVERRNLGELANLNEMLDSFIQKVKAVISLHQEHQQPAKEDGKDGGKFYAFWPQLLQMKATLKAILDGSTVESLASKDSNGCSLFDVKCKGTAVANHLPFSDADGDSYSTKKELRGSDWRGVDCDDKNPNIHPGRATLPAGVAPEADHNCNGISGKNGTSTYEELFCTGANAPRPLIALGDSATAHFHLPPQWFTAEGWNLDGLQRVLEDEMDAPACSWSTGHVDATECPYQSEVPGVPSGKIVSLYSQLRDRNRCNHNAYANVGVNGARMTSSSGLVDAIKSIDRENDAPVTLWLSLIGNDVCKSDTNYTPVDEFYNDAVATLTRLDQMLPKGSVVVSLALFNGEILYDTTHAQTHPLGTTYAAMYDWMICLQVTPCYGWLNSNADIRRQTSAHANKLNEQYVKIQAQSKTLFKNIDYLYFAAPYDEIFGGYVKSGFKGIDLIERVDGFHPSQAGNAAFAISFWKWLADSHPEAIGQVNPHNAEIDALFFANK